MHYDWDRTHLGVPKREQQWEPLLSASQKEAARCSFNKWVQNQKSSSWLVDNQEHERLFANPDLYMRELDCSVLGEVGRNERRLFRIGARNCKQNIAMIVKKDELFISSFVFLRKYSQE